jgi:hypothetical protein
LNKFDIAGDHFEEFIVGVCLLKQRVETTFVTVDQENLSESIACDKCNQSFHTFDVQLVENIVEQKDETKTRRFYGLLITVVAV